MSSSQTEARDEIAHQIAGNVAPEFAGIFSPETIERCAVQFYAALAEGARITDYLPVLTEHSVRVHLRPAAQAQGLMIDGVPEVLFVCARTLGRGQMAADLLERHAEGSVRARSASTSPSAEVEPEVVTALLGMGTDLSRHVPASLSEDVGMALGAQAGEARLRQVVTAGGFSRFRRAAATPFNLVLEARA